MESAPPAESRLRCNERTSPDECAKSWAAKTGFLRALLRGLLPVCGVFNLCEDYLGWDLLAFEEELWHKYHQSYAGQCMALWNTVPNSPVKRLYESLVIKLLGHRRGISFINNLAHALAQDGQPICHRLLCYYASPDFSTCICGFPFH